MIAAGLLLLALAGSPDANASPSPASQAAVQTGAPSTTPPLEADGQAVICKTIETTGTRFSSRICKTKSEWIAETQAAREFVNKSTSGVCTGAVCH